MGKFLAELANTPWLAWIRRYHLTLPFDSQPWQVAASGGVTHRRPRRVWSRRLIPRTVPIIALLVAAFVLPLGASGTSQPTWSQLSPAAHPSARGGHMMAYDPTTSQLILFGGLGSVGTSGDTWVWTGTTWSQLFPAASPPARSDAVMAYDQATSQLILFGGSGYLGDTWVWTGTTWSQLFPAVSPHGRDLAVMAYDPATSQLILFGGQNGQFGGTDLGDTWAWTGTTWRQLSPAASPGAREGAVMAYDQATSQLLLFGGFNLNGLGFPNDTWVWTGTTWSPLSPAASPPARAYAAMAYDPATSQLILFGGNQFGDLGDTWVWTGTTWNQLTPFASPPARHFAQMAYDASTSQFLLFGGIGGAVLSDTWVFQQVVVTIRTFLPFVRA